MYQHEAIQFLKFEALHYRLHAKHAQIAAEVVMTFDKKAVGSLINEAMRAAIPTPGSSISVKRSGDDIRFDFVNKERGCKVGDVWKYTDSHKECVVCKNCAPNSKMYAAQVSQILIANMVSWRAHANEIEGLDYQKLKEEFEDICSTIKEFESSYDSRILNLLRFRFRWV